MREAGFDRVFQLDGGILRYLEDCRGARWRGDCVVFDERQALRPDLSPVVDAAPGVQTAAHTSAGSSQASAAARVIPG
jgi:predicted sulfurtransferase